MCGDDVCFWGPGLSFRRGLDSDSLPLCLFTVVTCRAAAPLCSGTGCQVLAGIHPCGGEAVLGAQTQWFYPAEAELEGCPPFFAPMHTRSHSAVPVIGVREAWAVLAWLCPSLSSAGSVSYLRLLNLA